MKNLSTAAMVTFAAITINILLCAGLTQAQITNPKDPNWPAPVWPEIFEPNQPLMNLNIQMLDPNDWDIIRLNGLLWDGMDYYEPDDPNIYLYELPAWFWAWQCVKNQIYRLEMQMTVISRLP
jgi:hypothetical protein